MYFLHGTFCVLGLPHSTLHLKIQIGVGQPGELQYTRPHDLLMHMCSLSAH